MWKKSDENEKITNVNNAMGQVMWRPRKYGKIGVIIF